jgi:alpha-tubulin suppressor-like RCC1 family protein
MISQVAVSYHFMHLVTNLGNVYSKGKNKRGELGLGMVSS